MCFPVLDFRGGLVAKMFLFGTLACSYAFSTYLRYAHVEIYVPSLRLLLAQEQYWLGSPLH